MFQGGGMSQEGDGVLDGAGRAFSETWKTVGIVAAAVSIFSLVARVFSMPLSRIAQLAVDAFRATFHPWVSWVGVLLPFQLSEPMKDFMLVWLAIGGSLGRAFYRLLTTVRASEPAARSQGIFTRSIDAVLFRNRIAWLATLAACVLLWPLAMFLLFRRPIVCKSKGQTKWAVFDKQSSIPMAHAGSSRPMYQYKYDARFEFFFQLAIVFLVVVAFAALNTVAQKLA